MRLLILWVFVSLFTLSGFSQQTISRTNDKDKPVHPNVILTPVAFEITKPLRDNPVVAGDLFKKDEFHLNAHRDRTINPEITPPDFANMPKDPNVQTLATNRTSDRAPLLNFAGQNSGSYPPDCNGTVGYDYYFQVVNTTYAIYDKTTTNLVAGPSNLNSIFNASLPGAGCNSGDPIVLWDEHANRWFYAEFSLCTSNDYMLIAVSQTDDPTGSWYSWSYDVTDTPDYMKFGIWQDGYYMATNTSSGNDVYVFERDKMIAGNVSPMMIGFDNPNRPSTFDGFHCILPMDNDGDWAPGGTPGQFITIVDDGQSNPADQLWIYQMDVDWVTPANSTFARTQTLNVNAFSGNFNSSWNNIPQQGTTQKLDGISTVLMYRAQYRNFGSSQRLVIAHTIAESSTESSLRWYELINTGSGWSIRQQSTYNPDNISRWNMSIAMNDSYEIGIGYSVSNSSMYPGIRYVGQSTAENTAASGVLDIAETNVWTGSNYQTTYNRWGDYCNISIDPSDDHTFWYTNEYVASGTHGTRIVSFQFSTPTSAPNANFMADNLFPVPGQTVQFTDLSTHSPTSWSWSFSPATVTYTGGTDASSQNPQVSFDNAGYYTVSLTASNAYGNDTETKVDYIYAAPCSDPSNLNVSAVTNTSAQLSWTAGGGETAWNIEYGIQGFVQGTGSVVNSVTNPYTLSGLTSDTSYEFYVQANCGSGYTGNWVGPFSFTTLICSYCYSWGNTTYGTSTTKVIFNTINNTSAKPTDANGHAYSDYTSISTDITRNTSYNLSVYVNTDGNYRVYAKAWIDWNQDCDFDDAGEEYDLGSKKNSPNGITSGSPLSITVPSTAILGSTRMRISSKYNVSPTSCAQDFDGEVEDYTVNIVLCDNTLTTTWNGSTWNNGNPTTTTTAILDANYQTSTNGNITACGCKINTGKTLNVENGGFLSVEGNIENNGTIIVENEGSIVQKNDSGVNSGTGNYEINKTTGVYNNYDYIYWSSPVDNETIGSVFVENPVYKYSFNTANYLDEHSGNYPQTTGSIGDGYDDNGDDWSLVNGSTVMEEGKGYIVMGKGSPIPFNSSNIGGTQPAQTVVFNDGTIHNGIINVNVVKDQYNTNGLSGNDTYNTNLNFIGNPYPSAIDIKKLYTENSTVLTGTFYFWTHNIGIAANSGPNAYDFSNDSFATVTTNGTTIGYVLGSNNTTPAEYYIPSAQGFMANVTNNGTIHFNNDMRVTGNNTSFLRSLNTGSDTDGIWLNLTNDQGIFRQILLAFHESAADGFALGEDAPRMENGNYTDFYSKISDNQYRFAIQTLSSFETDKIIPLGLEITQSRTYQIGIDHMEGIFNNNQKVYLEDKMMNVIHDLTLGAYSFIQTAGDNINDRFVIRFTNTNALSTEDKILSYLLIYPNPSEGVFYLSYQDTEPVQVEIFDVLGKRLMSTKNPRSLDLSEFNPGIYLAKFSTKNGSITKKLVRD